MKRKESVPQEAENAPQDAKHRPLFTARIEDVSASIWGRDVMVGGKPRTFFSVTVQNSFVDKTGKRRWTTFFDSGSLGKLVTVVQQAAEKVEVMQQDADRYHKQQDQTADETADE